MEENANALSQEGENGVADLLVGDFVIVDYEAAHYPGKIISMPDSHNVTVKCFTKVGVVGSVWKWPHRDDITDYDRSKVVAKIETPRLLPGNGRKIEFYVTELEYAWGNS